MMTATFIHEDGHGNMVGDEGEDVAVIEMDVDYETYPLNSVTNFNEYMSLKPPEKPVKEPKAVEEQPKAKAKKGPKRLQARYTDAQKERLFYLVYEEGKSAREAALELKIAPRTAQRWVKMDQDNPDPDGGLPTTASKTTRPVGRPSKLGEEHAAFLTNLVDENPSLALDQMMESLTKQFEGLEVSKTALYNFTTEKCRITFKKAHFHSVERNSPAKIEERFNWVTRWLNTDMDFCSNCVFIDESAFHINMKRSSAWSTKGTRATVTVPKTRAKTTTILGAISPYGVVQISVRLPKAMPPSKKRKAAGSTKTVSATKSGTVTGHYFNFVASTLDVMDQHEEFKGNYLVMDNAPIHKHDDIAKYIQSRGYGCIYLPSYSPELNPIEQFWSVVKAKLKRHRLLEEETLTSRIRDACNEVYFSDLKGFCKYSVSKFDDCLQRKPL